MPGTRLIVPSRKMKGRPRAEELIDQDEAPEMQLNDTHEDSEMESASDDSDEASDSDNGSASDVTDASDDEPADPLKTTSFGSLARAQASLDRKRKREAEAESAANPQAGKLDALRSRLQDIKRARTDSGLAKGRPAETDRDRQGSDSASSSEEDDHDGDRRPSRSSKHAPTSQSSRYQVSRKRDVIPIARSTVRDPRFDGGPRHMGDNSWAGRAYSFLDDYEDTEMAELKAAIRKTRDEGDKMKLRRRLGAMENRRKAKGEKERRQKVLREHRRSERDAVAQGKKPFYLKEKEVKRRELVERFEGMKGKERERVVERRRKREAQKEKKNMPAARRIAG